MTTETTTRGPGRYERPFPEYEPPSHWESSTEAKERNRDARADWQRWADARCDVCAQVRLHVSHEMDPENSPEGPEYHADFEHHEFVEAGSDREGEPG